MRREKEERNGHIFPPIAEFAKCVRHDQQNLGILPRTCTRLVFCNKKLMRTDIFFTRTTKPICNFVNPAISQGCIMVLSIVML